MAHLTLGVLGALQVTLSDGETAKFRSDQTRALLAYLAVEADRPHRREALTGLLWPDESEEAARHNLSQALVNLRRTIGDSAAHPPYLLITRHEIQFNLASDFALDVTDFDAHLAACESHPHARLDNCAICAPRLQQAVDLYRGQFLQEFFLKNSAAFEEWALARREAFHHRALEALGALATYYEQHEDFGATRRCALRALELDPWREEAHRQLMRVFALEGQLGAALAQYETCHRVLAEEMGVEPSAETSELYGKIKQGKMCARTGELGSTLASITPPLPVSLTPFVGRERELAELRGLLAGPDCRLVTLVGPGGIGKTRLALQAAANSRDKFEQGAAFVSLGPVSSVGSIIPAIAAGLGFSFYGPADPQMQLLNYLREKQLLLILDNAEHLLEAAGLWIEILKQASQVKLLVTSREALNLQGEWIFEVDGLPTPETDRADELEACPAVVLLLERARHARVGFALDSEDRPAVARLCRLVGGMPLALELAATWTKSLSFREIVEEIEHSLDFLAASIRDLPVRHRSMRAVFDQSWRMLRPEERQALRQLSVFRGGFQREAAEEIAGATLPLLSMLQAKSLVRRMTSHPFAESLSVRYDLHELARQYATSKLVEDELECGKVRERHSDYYLRLVERHKATLWSSRQRQALDELTADIDNIRAAWDWAVAHHNAEPLCRVSHVFWYLYELRNWLAEGEQVFRNAAERLQSIESKAKPCDPGQVAANAMLAHSAFFSLRLGKSEEAFALLSKTVPCLRAVTDPLPSIYALWYLGIVSWHLGRSELAKESFQEAWAKSRESGELYYESSAGEFLGILAHDEGDYVRARHYLAGALVRARTLGDNNLIAHVLSYLCQTMLALEEYQGAETLLRESLALARQIDYRFGEGMALDRLGQVARARGAKIEARALFEESLAALKEVGYPPTLARALNHQGLNLLDLGDTQEAKECFNAALRVAYESRIVLMVLEALSGLAAVYAVNQEKETALEIVVHVLEHPATTQEVRNRAAGLRAQLESHLTPERIEIACVRARAETFDAMVQELQKTSD